MTTSLMNSINELPDKIPAGTLFEKLTNEGEPYVCSGWEHRTSRQEKVLCLCYQFPSRDGLSMNPKRVPLEEIKNAVIFLDKNKFFNRSTFNKICPITKSDGSCGFAVIGRILERFFNAEHRGRSGFILAS